MLQLQVAHKRISVFFVFIDIHPKAKARTGSPNVILCCHSGNASGKCFDLQDQKNKPIPARTEVNDRIRPLCESKDHQWCGSHH